MVNQSVTLLSVIKSKKIIMKELLQQYADYNIWATKQLLDRINKLSDEEINREIASSFSSVYKTLQHMWLAEEAWWQRLKLVEHLDLQSEKFAGSFPELTLHLAKQSQLWADWIRAATNAQLEHVFAYRNTKKEEFKQPVSEVIMHLFNHGSYHRGQLVTLLRQLGADKIPQTDFIVFSRKR